MKNQKARYQAWSDSIMQAWSEGDTSSIDNLWAEKCTRTSIDAFTDHDTISGRDDLRDLLIRWASGMKNPRLLKNEILSASEEKGIGNAKVGWTTGDGKEWACDFIYLISLDENDRCVSYTEWNVVQSREA
jgi:hypothetical protein